LNFQVERRLLRNHQPVKPQEKHHHHWLKSAISRPLQRKKETRRSGFLMLVF
jgi:hypothetical protein